MSSAAADRPRPRRAPAGLDAVCAGGDRDGARGRLPDRLCDLPLVPALRPALPGRPQFVGFENYITILKSTDLWWQAFGITILITVVSVAIELVLGMAVALVMHRAVFGRGLVRTAVLVPYGIVTVVAAFSWQYAWTPGTGYLAGLLHLATAPLTDKWQAIGIIILAEVWKTTPFMALLLLAGLALVPEELLRAAKVDGATAWQRFPQGDPAGDEAGDPGGAALPHAGRLPHLRQHLHPHPGAHHTQSVSILGYDQLFIGAQPRRRARRSRC